VRSAQAQRGAEGTDAKRAAKMLAEHRAEGKGPKGPRSEAKHHGRSPGCRDERRASEARRAECAAKMLAEHRAEGKGPKGPRNEDARRASSGGEADAVRHRAEQGKVTRL
jgi:hypothetical protein